ncbi:MAG: hypothetical protein ACLT1J_08940 [Mediterraneibacter gnavus]
MVDRFLGLASFNPLYFNDGTPNPETCKPICRPDQLAEVKEANDIAGYVTKKLHRKQDLPLEHLLSSEQMTREQKQSAPVLLHLVK